jgi:rhodanese-related sulfurtransferase
MKKGGITMKRILLLLSLALLALPTFARASDYNYLSAEELKGWLEAGKAMLLVDIQEPKDFAAHHLKGSLETNAYPVKSEAERATLVPALARYQAEKPEAVVVVCPRGKGGAKRAYDYLREQGVPEARLVILTGGMEKWPHPEWVESK